MLTQSIKRITAAGFAGSLLAIAPMVLPAADAAPATGCRQYAVQSTTTTTLSVSPAGPYSVGQSFTATADGHGRRHRPAGSGRQRSSSSTARPRKTVAVSGGSASATFTAKRGRTPISATFSGECLAGSVANGTSADRTPIVAGVEASRGGGGNGNSGVAGVSGSAAAATSPASLPPVWTARPSSSASWASAW